MHRGSLPAAAQTEAIALGTRATSSDIRGLFETFLPESQRRATLGANFDPELVLTAPGDIARGKLIFSSDGARCRACHDAADRAASLGPTLQEINKKYPLAADMLQHVINPSQKIEDPFAAYAVQTHDGQTHPGLQATDTNDEIPLKTADKKLLRIPRTQIAALQKSTKSLMPDQVLSDLTAQEAADLLAYLRSLGASGD
jgi:putative heme-binding domain-containing protein